MKAFTAEPKPNQPGSISRHCAHENTQGIARRSSIAWRLLARGGARADVEGRDLGDDGRGPEIAHETHRSRRPGRDRPCKPLPTIPPSHREKRDRAPRFRPATASPRASPSERLEIAPADLGIGIFARDDFALLGDADLALHRAARLGEDRVVARAAAAADRAAAAVEQADAHAVLAEDLDQADLGLVQFPARGDEAAVLVGIGIAEHHLLLAALRIDEPAIFGNRQQAVHDADAGAQVLDRLEQRNQRRATSTLSAASTRPTSFISSASSSMSETLWVFEMMLVRIAPGPYFSRIVARGAE